MSEEREKKGRPPQKTTILLLISIAIVAAGVGLYFYLQYVRTHISTDDAYVDGHIHVVASKVGGTVKAIYVQDNQFVKQGDLLVQIDPVDYANLVEQARYGVSSEEAKAAEIRQGIETAKKQLLGASSALQAGRANLELQEANLRQNRKDMERAEYLASRGYIAKQQSEQVETAYEVTAAQVKAAADNIKQLEAALETQKSVVSQTEASLSTELAVIKQKKSQLEQALLNEKYTKLYAPTEGYVTKRSVEAGNQIQANQPLLAVVPLSQQEVWITANYKETQLKNVRPGQKVKIEVDTYPGKIFNGAVDSIMAGTGSAFSLFPPENATGNFVKVVQRIPVKIVLDKGEDPQHLLRVGMSVVPTILTDSKLP